MTLKTVRWLMILLTVLLAHACQKSPDSSERGVSEVTETIEPGTFGKYHALIIGINEYRIWPKLKYARGDAERIGKELTSRYTFDPGNVTYLLDDEATLERIMRELRRKLEQLGENDNLLVYYAGHGQLDPLTEAGYWIPVDGKLDVDTTWIMFSTIQTLLAATNVKAKNIVLLTDSCYGGSITRGAPTPGNTSPEVSGYPQYEQRLKGLAKKRSRQVIASGGADVTVPDRSDFANLVVNALQDNKYPLTDVEMLFFRDVYPQLRFSGQQDPVIARVAPRPGEDGQFVLVKRDAVVEQPDASTTGSTTGRGVGEIAGDTTTTTKKGTLTVESNVNGDTVYINDKPKGSTRLETEMEPGSYTIRVEKAGYSTYTQRIDLATGDKLTVKAVLQPLQSPLPVVELYQANTNSIEAGQRVTLQWRTKNASRVVIKGVGEVATSGQADVTPDRDTTYSLRATNTQGKHTIAEVKIIVRPIEPPVIELFSATPESVNPGQRSRLVWKTSNAEEVILEGVGKVALSGSQEVSPDNTTHYTLTAKNKSGQSVQKTAGVAVNAAAARILNFTASKTSINAGENVTLNWRIENAATVEIAPLGRVNAQGSKVVTPQSATTYILIASNSTGQSVRQQITINVSSGPAAENQCPYGKDQCLPGYVWREAFSGDHVCVTSQVRAQAAADNRLAATRKSPTGGAYGADTCLPGFVWREASPTDHVCVTGTTREQTRKDNAAAASRRDPKCSSVKPAIRLQTPLRLERPDAPVLRIQP